jgi:hypothetical protein
MMIVWDWNGGSSLKTRKIPDHDALQLSTRGEDHFFDRKSLSISGKQLQKIAGTLIRRLA